MRNTLSFQHSRVWNDNERRIAFTAEVAGKTVVFHVPFTTLKKFGAISSHEDAHKVFSQNLPTIRRAASALYQRGKVVLDREAFERDVS